MKVPHSPLKPPPIYRMETPTNKPNRCGTQVETATCDEHNEEYSKVLITRQYAVDNTACLAQIEALFKKYEGELCAIYMRLAHRHGELPEHRTVHVADSTETKNPDGARKFISARPEALRKKSNADQTKQTGKKVSGATVNTAEVQAYRPVFVTTRLANHEINKRACRICGKITTPLHWGNECPANPLRQVRGQNHARSSSR